MPYLLMVKNTGWFRIHKEFKSPPTSRLHTDPGKSRNLKFKFSRPAKSGNLLESQGR